MSQRPPVYGFAYRDGGLASVPGRSLVDLSLLRSGPHTDSTSAHLFRPLALLCRLMTSVCLREHCSISESSERPPSSGGYRRHLRTPSCRFSHYHRIMWSLLSTDCPDPGLVPIYKRSSLSSRTMPCRLTTGRILSRQALDLIFFDLRFCRVD